MRIDFKDPVTSVATDLVTITAIVIPSEEGNLEDVKAYINNMLKDSADLFSPVSRNSEHPNFYVLSFQNVDNEKVLIIDINIPIITSSTVLDGFTIYKDGKWVISGEAILSFILHKCYMFNKRLN